MVVEICAAYTESFEYSLKNKDHTYYVVLRLWGFHVVTNHLVVSATRKSIHFGYDIGYRLKNKNFRSFRSTSSVFRIRKIASLTFVRDEDVSPQDADFSSVSTFQVCMWPNNTTRPRRNEAPGILDTKDSNGCNSRHLRRSYTWAAFAHILWQTDDVLRSTTKYSGFWCERLVTILCTGRLQLLGLSIHGVTVRKPWHYTAEYVTSRSVALPCAILELKLSHIDIRCTCHSSPTALDCTRSSLHRVSTFPQSLSVSNIAIVISDHHWNGCHPINCSCFVT